MFCTQCGTEHNEAFCAVCGQSADGSASNATTNGPGTPDPVTGLALSGWWRRVGSTIVDSLVLIPVALLTLFFDHHTKSTLDSTGFITYSSSNSVAATLIKAAGTAIYLYFFWTTRKGETLGNRATGTRVVMADGSPVTTDAALKRVGVITVLAVAPLAGSALITLAGIGGLLDRAWPLWDSRKQTLHDKFADTIVIRSK